MSDDLAPHPTSSARALRPRGPRAEAVRRVARPVALLGGVVAAFGYVGAVDPNRPGHYPACPILHLTGLYCPGCGGLRSAHALAHGDLTGAVGANALAVAAYATFAVLWAVWATRAVRGRGPRLPQPRLRRAYGWSLAALVVLFTVVRNTPFGAGLAP